MSAAEPIDPPGRPHAVADVIQFADYLAVRDRFTSRTRRRVPDQGGADDPVVRTALLIEAVFDHHGLTLTDPAAAAAFQASLKAVEMMLEGARRQGTIDTGQHTTLSGMIEGMRLTPDRL